jgi:DNA-binding transcriptional LysR family regulator
MRGAPDHVDELRGHHFVLRGPAQPRLTRLSVVIRMSTDEIETAYVAVLAGVGLSILPRWLVATDVSEGRLNRLLPDFDLGGAPIVATFPSTKRLRKPARQVLERLGQTLSVALARSLPES